MRPPARTASPASTASRPTPLWRAGKDDFNVNFGDTIYSDSELAGAAVARTVEQKHAKYRLGLALPRAAAGAPRRGGAQPGWDDHEFVNDYAGEEHGALIYRESVRAFLDYTPASYTPRTGLYRTFRWGRHLELFFLDGRSFRAAKANAVCGDDIAPTAPPAVRQAFAALAPSLAKPVPQATSTRSPRRSGRCSGASEYPPRSRGRSFLDRDLQGRRQPHRAVDAAPICAAVRPMGGTPPTGRACWQHSRASATSSPGHPRAPDRGDPVVDLRAGRARRDGDLGGDHWACRDEHVRERDRRLPGLPGIRNVVTGALFKPGLPHPGSDCGAQTDRYGYAQVTVTSTRLTVSGETASGGVVPDVTGPPCAPLVVRAA